jgi:transcriptional regulator with XRE-family HTH domain
MTTTRRPSKAITPTNIVVLALIHDAFKASPLSQTELADKTGIPRGTIAKILSTKQLAPVYADQLVVLADALDADLAAWVAAIREVRNPRVPRNRAK